MDRRGARPWLLGAASILAVGIALRVIGGELGRSTPHAAPAPSDAPEGEAEAAGPARELGGGPHSVEGWIERFLSPESSRDEAEARRRIVAFGAAALPALLDAMRVGPDRTKVAALYGSLDGASAEECVALLREGRV